MLETAWLWQCNSPWVLIYPPDSPESPLLSLYTMTDRGIDGYVCYYYAPDRPGSIYCLSFGLHSSLSIPLLWQSWMQKRDRKSSSKPKKASLSVFTWGGKKGSTKLLHASSLWPWHITFRHESCSHHPNMTNTCILPKHRHTVMRQLGVLTGTVLFPLIFFLKCIFAVSQYYNWIFHFTPGCLGVLSHAWSGAKGCWSAASWKY